MASFYELTEEEIDLLIRGLDCLDSESMYDVTEEERTLLALKRYLETRER